MHFTFVTNQHFCAVEFEIDNKFKILQKQAFDINWVFFRSNTPILLRNIMTLNNAVFQYDCVDFYTTHFKCSHTLFIISFIIKSNAFINYLADLVS